MIKKPDTDHPLEIIDTPTQLVDLYPTILDILNVEDPKGLHGHSIYGPGTPPREARLALDPEYQYGPSLIEIRIDDPTNLDTSSLTVLGPATDPNVSRAEIKRAYGSANPESEASEAMAPAPDRPAAFGG